MILIVRPQASTDPAPLVLALRTGHVLAAEILLYKDSAVGTAGSAIHDSPTLVEFLFCLFTGFSLMPRGHTAEAHLLLTGRAFNLFVFFSCLHYGLTLGSGAKLFLTVHCDFMILAVLFELSEGLIIHKAFQEFVWDYFGAPRLWARHLMALP